MKYRLFAAVACTALSFMALAASFKAPVPLWVASWAIYLVILCFWIKNNRAPKVLLIAGTALGSASIISSYFLALLWAFPSIALMLHVIKCSFFAGARGRKTEAQFQ